MDAVARDRSRYRVSLALGVVAGSGLLWLLRDGPPSGVVVFALAAMAPAAIVFLIRRSVHDAMLWAGCMGALAGFTGLRAIATGAGFPVRYEYVITLDRLLGLGNLPTEWLQTRFHTVGAPSPFDWVMIVVHASYFLAPFLVAFVVWGFWRQHLLHYFLTILITYYASLVVLLVLPTAPPWLAALDGYVGDVSRIVAGATWEADPEAYRAAALLADSNPVAAMPSLHTASTVIAALMLARLGIIAGVVGWSYAALMAFALVYLGEHYVVDTLAGAGLAVVVWRGTNRWLGGRLPRAPERYVVMRDRAGGREARGVAAGLTARAR